MTEEKKIPLKKSKGNIFKFLNRDFAVFSFFLILSFLFWCLNALGKVTEAEISYTVTFSNPPKEREFIEDQSSSISLIFKGTGYSTLKLKLLRRKKPVVVDLSNINYKRVPGSKNLDYFVITSSLTKSLTARFRTECEIASMKPDTLFFSLNIIPLESNPIVPDSKTDEGSD